MPTSTAATGPASGPHGPSCPKLYHPHGTLCAADCPTCLGSPLHEAVTPHDDGTLLEYRLRMALPGGLIIHDTGVAPRRQLIATLGWLDGFLIGADPIQVEVRAIHNLPAWEPLTP